MSAPRTRQIHRDIEGDLSRLPGKVLRQIGKKTPMATRKIFASSPMPNQRMGSGMVARRGTFRSILQRESSSASAGRERPVGTLGRKSIESPCMASGYCFMSYSKLYGLNRFSGFLWTRPRWRFIGEAALRHLVRPPPGGWCRCLPRELDAGHGFQPHSKGKKRKLWQTIQQFTRR